MLKKIVVIIMIMVSNKAMEQPEFSFRPLTKRDLPLIYQWFQDPDVRYWWPTPTQEEDFFRDFLKRIRSSETVAYLVFVDSKAFAYLQYYPIDRVKNNWLPELPEHTVGIDQFIGPAEYRGKGLGVLFIKAFIAFLSEKDKNMKTVIVDPDPKNKIAIRCYEKVGFKAIGEFQGKHGKHLLMRYDVTES